MITHPVRKRADRSGRGGRPWRRLRERVLTRDGYLCQLCREAGRVTEAAEVDHILPLSRGGDDSESNLQAICAPCHRAKSLAEDPSVRAARIPEWLRPPLVPVTIVAGPPAAGKSTFVRERAGPRDLVLDLDEIASEVSALPLYHAGPEWVAPALRARNARLASLADAPARYDAAWLIVTAPMYSERRKWRDLLTGTHQARVYVIAAEAEACLRRLAGRPAPSGGYSWGDIVSRWWSRYSAGREETVIGGEA